MYPNLNAISSFCWEVESLNSMPASTAVVDHRRKVVWHNNHRGSLLAYHSAMATGEDEAEPGRLPADALLAIPLEGMGFS